MWVGSSYYTKQCMITCMNNGYLIYFMIPKRFRESGKIRMILQYSGIKTWADLSRSPCQWKIILLYKQGITIYTKVINYVTRITQRVKHLQIRRRHTSSIDVLKVLSSEWGGTSECGGISYLVVPGTPWRCIKTSLPRGSWRWRIIWFQSLQSFRIQTREWIPSTPTDDSWRKLPPSCQQRDSRSMLENTDSSTFDCKFSFNKYM